MTHFLTLLRCDDVNLKAWAYHVRIGGGGSIRRTKRGVEIHAKDLPRLAKLLCWLNY